VHESFVLIEKGPGLLCPDDERPSAGAHGEDHEDPAAEGGTWHPCQAA